MAASLMEYEVLKVGPEPEAIKEALNEKGRYGYVICHTEVDAEGTYTFIMSRNTGRSPEGEEVTGEWIDDGFVNEETAWT